MFPRKINRVERSVLLSILPDNKPGYNKYREKISEMFVIGNGRFDGSNYVLGHEGDSPDLENPSAPVFAMGKIKYQDQVHDVAIHEEKDNKIEIELDGLDKLEPDEVSESDFELWSYSEWQPGEKAPGDNSSVREVNLPGNSFMLVFVPKHKRMWVHEFQSGVNYLLPVTNYFNELMMYKRDKSGRQPNRLFDELSDFTDEDLTSAFINYGRYLKKFKIASRDIQVRNTEKKKLFNLFSNRG